MGAIDITGPVLGTALGMIRTLWLPAVLVLILVPIVVSLHRRLGRHLPVVGTEGLAALPVHFQLLPVGVRRFFDLQHPGLDALGFTFVGDCRIVQGPSPVYCRYYAGVDGRVHVEVAVARFGSSRQIGPADLEAVTLVTVFEDGVSMQTCDLGFGEREDAGPDEFNVFYRFRPCVSIAQLLEDHVDAVEDYAAEHRTLPLRYPPEQVVEVSLRYAESQRASEFAYNPLRPPSVYAPGPAYACPVPNIRPLAYIDG